MLLRKQKGLSTLEAMLGVTILAVVFLMATRMFTSANNMVKMQSAVQLSGGLLSAETMYKMANGVYGSVAQLQTNGLIVPAQLIDPWSNAIVVTLVGTTGYTFKMTPPTAGICNQIAGLLTQTGFTASCSTNVLTVTGS